MAIPQAAPKRPVPVIHFHGTADTMVPFGGPGQQTPAFLKFKTVPESVMAWVKINECPTKPRTIELQDTANDGTSVKQEVYGPGKDGSEVILVTINGGGHTWPGQQPLVQFIGKSTRNISANDMIWDFFLRHPMKP
jgi:polyhydroxybutyrate depolymerase